VKSLRFPDRGGFGEGAYGAGVKATLGAG